MIVEKHYNLKFLTYDDTIATIRVPKAGTVSPVYVKDAMQKILDSGVVATSAGIIKSLYGADLVTVTTTDCEYEQQF